MHGGVREPRGKELGGDGALEEGEEPGEGRGGADASQGGEDNGSKVSAQVYAASKVLLLLQRIALKKHAGSIEGGCTGIGGEEWARDCRVKPYNGWVAVMGGEEDVELST